ncbi:hypothetical protein T492DRAFT_529178 [Pavlovales sp. CCMP2436]|nr:hypothetical protein T492DRAFT_529178 [Pavlovales sp. CCMP2436]
MISSEESPAAIMAPTMAPLDVPTTQPSRSGVSCPMSSSKRATPQWLLKQRNPLLRTSRCRGNVLPPAVAAAKATSESASESAILETFWMQTADAGVAERGSCCTRARARAVRAGVPTSSCPDFNCQAGAISRLKNLNGAENCCVRVRGGWATLAAREACASDTLHAPRRHPFRSCHRQPT